MDFYTQGIEEEEQSVFNLKGFDLELNKKNLKIFNRELNNLKIRNPKLILFYILKEKEKIELLKNRGITNLEDNINILYSSLPMAKIINKISNGTILKVNIDINKLSANKEGIKMFKLNNDLIVKNTLSESLLFSFSAKYKGKIYPDEILDSFVVRDGKIISK